MDSLKHENKADVIEAFNSISRYLDEFLNIDGPYFERTVSQIYPPELKLNKPIPQIPKPPYKIYIFLFQMDLFLQKFMISGTTLNLI